MSGAGVLVDFGRRLRSAGLAVGPTIAADLAAAADAVGLASGEDTFHAFRAVCVTSVDELPVFSRVFMETFGWDGPPPGLALIEERPRTWSIEPLDEGGEGDGTNPVDDVEVVGASAVERLAEKDFAELTDEESAQVKAMVAAMVWKPGFAVSRRRRPSRAGDRPDPRRTLAHLAGTEGDLLLPAFSGRKIRRRPLLIIADVSGSMERYSEMLLYFAHAARGHLGRLEAFVFSTSLTRITRELERRSPSEAIARVSDSVHDWSGGTKIGAALGEFNRSWSRRVTSGGPIAVIISDGWDRGEPELLAEEMDRLSRSVHRVVWLNPLASRPGFAPETRGMQAALPYVDDFLAAGKFSDLASVVRLLESIPERRRR